MNQKKFSILDKRKISKLHWILNDGHFLPIDGTPLADGSSSCCNFLVCGARSRLQRKEDRSSCDDDPSKYDDAHRLAQSNQDGERSDNWRSCQKAEGAVGRRGGDGRTSS